MYWFYFKVCPYRGKNLRQRHEYRCTGESWTASKVREGIYVHMWVWTTLNGEIPAVSGLEFPPRIECGRRPEKVPGIQKEKRNTSKDNNPLCVFGSGISIEYTSRVEFGFSALQALWSFHGTSMWNSNFDMALIVTSHSWSWMRCQFIMGKWTYWIDTEVIRIELQCITRGRRRKILQLMCSYFIYLVNIYQKEK